MAGNSLQVEKLPLDTYIDALRWLPHISAFTRQILLAAYDSDTNTPSLKTLTFSPSSNPISLTLESSLSLPSRVTSLKNFPSLYSNSRQPIVASTFSGSLLFYSADLVNGSLNSEFVVPEKGFHSGPISAIDLSDNGSECVSVGEDGKVNLVSLSGKSGFRRVFDSNGLVSYTAVKWASPVEFVTGSFGFGLQWWDQRKAGGPEHTFKPNWSRSNTSGIVHSIDIHPSRKHTCLAGGSSGTMFAWDTRNPQEPIVLSPASSCKLPLKFANLQAGGSSGTMFAWDTRNPQEPIVLSGVGIADAPKNSLIESDIWEVQFDNYTNPSKMSNPSSSKVLPAMVCSEDGILAVIEKDEEPIELLEEPCAINSFDIDRQNPSDVICSLEWESIAILSRP